MIGQLVRSLWHGRARIRGAECRRLMRGGLPLDSPPSLCPSLELRHFAPTEPVRPLGERPLPRRGCLADHVLETDGRFQRRTHRVERHIPGLLTHDAVYRDSDPPLERLYR